jgi:hypothetical protein
VVSKPKNDIVATALLCAQIKATAMKARETEGLKREQNGTEVRGLEG